MGGLAQTATQSMYPDSCWSTPQLRPVSELCSKAADDTVQHNSGEQVRKGWHPAPELLSEFI